jgi:DNA invertase Pin-like site-specific DNA recombinase
MTTNTNGHRPKGAILYARVSTRQQAEEDRFSIPQQLHALREYCQREGFDVIEEITDPGFSGASLERPGMDKVRDLVASGGVDAVFAQDRDRFSREPAFHYILREEFAHYGTDMRALNDKGDGSPEGQLTDGIMDQLAKFEKSKFVQRSRRGKIQRARDGKIVPTYTPDYGFAYSRDRLSYVVVEEQMEIVRRVFAMIADGFAIRYVRRTLESEGVPTPRGGTHWSQKTIRQMILDDVYMPHDREAIAALVEEGLMARDVAGRLEPDARYGIWFFNTRRYTRTSVVETGPDGERVYRKRQTSEQRPRHQWVAVPVPDSGVPLEHVERA